MSVEVFFLAFDFSPPGIEIKVFEDFFSFLPEKRKKQKKYFFVESAKEGSTDGGQV